MEDLYTKLNKATSVKKLLSYQDDIDKLCEHYYNKLINGICNMSNYTDIKYLEELNFPMMAYFGPSFYEKCGLPFLNEYNKITLDIIEYTILFYTLQIFELLAHNFWEDIVNRRLLNENDKLFFNAWYIFMSEITIKNNTRKFMFENKEWITDYLVSDEEHEKLLDFTLDKFTNNKYKDIIYKILGMYKVRFSKIKYILEYQPLFVKVSYTYLCTLIPEPRIEINN